MFDGGRYVEKKTFNVEGMFKAGPYSQAVEAGGFLFLSGVIPVDAQKALSIKDDIKAATTLVLENINTILSRGGSSLEKAVKVTVYLRDMADFPEMNEVYKEYFPAGQPARSCVAVREIPGDYPVEIDLIAIK
jgi:2-iminobutanoate/2-iminopropanoate deaminase